MTTLADQWLAAKAAEQTAQRRRREIEDEMLASFGLAEHVEGTESREANGYKIKVTARQNRRIDADKLQEVALDAGVHDHLASLFRWKPEINAKAWSAADERITRPLLEAITTTPGRPSFAIEPIESVELKEGK